MTFHRHRVPAARTGKLGLGGKKWTTSSLILTVIRKEFPMVCICCFEPTHESAPPPKREGINIFASDGDFGDYGCDTSRTVHKAFLYEKVRRFGAVAYFLSIPSFRFDVLQQTANKTVVSGVQRPANENCCPPFSNMIFIKYCFRLTGIYSVCNMRPHCSYKSWPTFAVKTFFCKRRDNPR